MPEGRGNAEQRMSLCCAVLHQPAHLGGRRGTRSERGRLRVRLAVTALLAA